MKDFFEFLRSSREFWLLVLALIIGMLAAAWASTRLIPASFGGLVFSLSLTFFVGMGIILRSGHNYYRSAKAQDFSISSKKDSLSLKGKVISTIPVILAGIADVYFILTKSFDSILVVIAIAFPLWICLRFIMAATEKNSEL